MGTGSAVISKKKETHETTEENTKEIRQARGTPGRKRTQETQGNTIQSLRARRSYTGVRETRDHKKHQGTPRKPEEHKGAKATQDSKFPPTSNERPAAREQKAKENITKIPLRSLPKFKWYQKHSKIDQKTIENDTKMPPKRGVTQKHAFCLIFLLHLHPQGPPRRPKGFQKVSKNVSKTTPKSTSKKASKNTSKKLP